LNSPGPQSKVNCAGLQGHAHLRGFRPCTGSFLEAENSWRGTKVRVEYHAVSGRGRSRTGVNGRFAPGPFFRHRDRDASRGRSPNPRPVSATSGGRRPWSNHTVIPGGVPANPITFFLSPVLVAAGPRQRARRTVGSPRCPPVGRCSGRLRGPRWDVASARFQPGAAGPQPEVNQKIGGTTKIGNNSAGVATQKP